jgi:deoxyribonuclease V
MDSKVLTSPPPWDLTLKEAIAAQKRLAGKVIRRSGSDIEDVATVAGVDTHFHQGLAIAAVVVIRLSDLATVDCATAIRKIRFPYMPGLLVMSRNNLTWLNRK